MTPYEALYRRRCRSPVGWFEVGEAGLIGPNLVHKAIEKVKVIQERLKTAQSCQKSYTDVRRRELEFEVDNWMYLKVSPMIGVMRFGKKEMLSPRYISLYRISKRVGNVAYELELPQEFIKSGQENSDLDKNQYPNLRIKTKQIGKGAEEYGRTSVAITP
ncbi:uncharacterized protein LOC125840839 [Solanum verrucosum]|uniref:uncharacterized protein LOC125840839 n=1 Tax=Solanum verrucosum TaxID=315347 RepID=UPI0020D0E462|nr:uncharacterized protein LOC125840839 [Solanum verrucosum]